MFMNPQLHGEFKTRLCYVRHGLQRKERSGGSEGGKERGYEGNNSRSHGGAVGGAIRRHQRVKTFMECHVHA